MGLCNISVTLHTKRRFEIFKDMENGILETRINTGFSDKWLKTIKNR